MCSGSTASVTEFDGSADCESNRNNTDPIQVNGSCGTGTCMSFDELEYNEANCRGKPVQNRTDSVTFNDSGCNYNKTQACVNGEPQTKFYNNTMCSGDPVHIITGDTCTTQGHNSRISKILDNPCS